MSGNNGTLMSAAVGRIGYLAVLVAVCLLVGCAGFKGYPDRPTMPQDDIDELKCKISADKIASCFDKTGDEGELCRNNLVTARMYAIDIKFSEFEKDLFRQTREVGFWATLVNLGLTGAASLSAVTTAHILSAAATGVTGSRAAYEKEILAQQTVIAIVTAMHANRTKIEARIRQGLKSPIKDYPVGLALGDLEEYYFAGTVLGALVGITESVGTEATVAKAELKTVIQGYSTEPASQYLKAFLFDKTISEELRRQRIGQVREEYGKLGVDVTRYMGDIVSDPNLRNQTETVARKFQWPG